MSSESFGLRLKELRLAAGYGLREFCVLKNLDPAYISRLERGRHVPPSAEKLEELAVAVGLKPDTEEWHEFLDLAAIGAKRIPKDVLDDEETVALLPAVFRTFRNDKVDREKLERLKELLRKA